MTNNNTYSILTSYLRYQRDIGIDEFIFDHASALTVKKLIHGDTANIANIANIANTANTANTANKYSQPQPQSQNARMSQPTQTTSKSFGRDVSSASIAAPDTSPLAKLAKIRPADSLIMRKFDKPAQPPVGVTASARREKLAALYRETVKCDKCALSAGRVKVVFGAGSADGKLLVVSDMPSAQDEAAGLPFQGEIGDLFGRMLDRMGLDRKEDVFATYLQKCRNGDVNVSNAGEQNPSLQTACKSILDKQIAIIEPKILLIFGQSAANFLLENNDGIEQLRNASHTYKSTPVIVSYSLSLMLEETKYRHGAWEDMKKALNMM